MQNKRTLGIILALIAAAALASNGLFVKFLGGNVSNAMIIFAQFFMILLITAPSALILEKKDLAIKHSKRWLARCLFGIANVSCLFYAIKHIPLADAMLLFNANPIYVPIILLIWKKSSSPKMLWIGDIISILGLTIILNPTGSIFQIASVVGLLSGIFIAATNIFIRELEKDHSPSVLVFYYSLFISIVTGIYMLFTWHSLTMRQILTLLAIGVFAYIYQYFMTKALEYASAKIITPIFFSTIVFGAIYDWIFWQHVPHLNTIIGSLVVFSGLLLVVISHPPAKQLQ